MRKIRNRSKDLGVEEVFINGSANVKIKGGEVPHPKVTVIFQLSIP